MCWRPRRWLQCACFGFFPRHEPDPMTTRETLVLVRAYYKIEDKNVRKRLYEMAKALGADAGKDS